jgi:hypothetical protein
VIRHGHGAMRALTNANGLDSSSRARHARKCGTGGAPRDSRRAHTRCGANAYRRHGSASASAYHCGRAEVCRDPQPASREGCRLWAAATARRQPPALSKSLHQEGLLPHAARTCACSPDHAPTRRKPAPTGTMTERRKAGVEGQLGAFFRRNEARRRTSAAGYSRAKSFLLSACLVNAQGECRFRRKARQITDSRLNSASRDIHGLPGSRTSCGVAGRRLPPARAPARNSRRTCARPSCSGGPHGARAPDTPKPAASRR